MTDLQAIREQAQAHIDDFERLSRGFLVPPAVVNFARDLLSALDREKVLEGEAEKLKTFYDVASVRELLVAMENHIGRLQSKLPSSSESFSQSKVREG